jgi:hypothetical protein
MGRTGREVAVRSQIQRGMGCHQVLVEVGFLLGQGEAQPFGKDLVMTVAERAIGDFATHHLAQRRVRILPGGRIAQARQKDEAAEVGRNSRERFPPQYRSRSASRFRFCDEVRQTCPQIPWFPKRHSSLRIGTKQPASISEPRYDSISRDVRAGLKWTDPVHFRSSV